MYEPKGRCPHGCDKGWIITQMTSGRYAGMWFGQLCPCCVPDKEKIENEFGITKLY